MGVSCVWAFTGDDERAGAKSTANGRTRWEPPQERAFQRSTNALSRPSASSHWPDNSARDYCRTRKAFGPTVNRLSRPWRRVRTNTDAHLASTYQVYDWRP